MAMGPGKLKSYMDSKEGNPAEEEHDEYEPEEEALEEESHEEDEQEVVDEEGFVEFLNILHANGAELDTAAGEIAEELTHESQPSPETVEQMQEQLSDMPPQITEGIVDFIKGMEYDHVIELAGQLADEGDIEDPMQVGGWLYWVAKNV